MTPQRKRRAEFEKQLKELNVYIWARDRAACAVCGSTKIHGKPFESGAHHILSRGSHPEIRTEERNLCLLCTHCHSVANTKRYARGLMMLLNNRYSYDYTQSPYSEVWNE